ncbi:MAG TPA: RING finger domain-containing protein, partial [Aquella sp.]|nr:RING finger domain-containing protein [Aquella sp.]
MDAYKTFFNKTLTTIVPTDLESEFNIKIGTTSIQNLTYPELITSVCSCKKNDNTDIINNITSYITVTNPQIDMCAICRNKMESHNVVRSNACAHEYHFDCIREWLSQNNMCPLCGTPWKFIFDHAEIFPIVHFGEKTKVFDLDTTELDVCNYFGVSNERYRLCKNGSDLEKVSLIEKLGVGSYSLCTIDSHHGPSAIAGITCVDTIKSQTKKFFFKLSWQIKLLRNEIAHIFGMISDNISLFHNGIELSSELDDFNLFNVGIKNESHIMMTHRKPKYNIDVCHESAFVTIYADSDFISNSTDSVARMLAGRSSWYPSAYLQISNTDMSC